MLLEGFELRQCSRLTPLRITKLCWAQSSTGDQNICLTRFLAWRRVCCASACRDSHDFLVVRRKTVLDSAGCFAGERVDLTLVATKGA